MVEENKWAVMVSMWLVRIMFLRLLICALPRTSII
nr:MAG TPA: hypothetical protein [Caudoviricetes sp.]